MNYNKKYKNQLYNRDYYYDNDIIMMNHKMLFYAFIFFNICDGIKCLCLQITFIM